jgi:hypothetical protein
MLLYEKKSGVIELIFVIFLSVLYSASTTTASAQVKISLWWGASDLKSIT